MKRLAVYTEFCAKKHAVLFATDVAARGLDFPAVQWVLQADCPEDVACYIHRTGRTARHTAGGRALLLLTTFETHMLKLLEASRIKPNRLSPNSSRLFPLRTKLQGVLSQRPELKYTAQRALVSYVRSVHLQSNKDVFDAATLPLEELALNMGLAAAPRVRFLGGGKKDSKNWSGPDSAQDAQDDTVGIHDDEERAQEERAPSSSEGEDEELISKAKKRKATPRNKLMRLLSRSSADRRGDTPQSRSQPELGGADAPSEELLQVKRCILPDSTSDGLLEDVDSADAVEMAPRPATQPRKIKIRKGGTVAGNKHTVFDESGQQLESRLEGGFADIVQEKADMHPQNAEDRVAAVQAALRAAASADRERERERVREKHKDQKRKRKLREDGENQPQMRPRKPSCVWACVSLGAAFATRSFVMQLLTVLQASRSMRIVAFSSPTSKVLQAILQHPASRGRWAAAPRNLLH
jgi:ATP-dependent RNA helicase DDX10/DBP4